MTMYKVVHETPSISDYLRLRKLSGLSEKSEEAASKALPNTLFGVCITYGDEVVGMGRVVGDGGVSFEVRDIAVLPEHQKKGQGKAIMDAIMNYVHAEVPKGAYITLFADPGRPSLYERYGFQVSEPLMTGMHLKKE